MRDVYIKTIDNNGFHNFMFDDFDMADFTTKFEQGETIELFSTCDVKIEPDEVESIQIYKDGILENTYSIFDENTDADAEGILQEFNDELREAVDSLENMTKLLENKYPFLDIEINYSSDIDEMYDYMRGLLEDE